MTRSTRSTAARTDDLDRKLPRERTVAPVIPLFRQSALIGRQRELDVLEGAWQRARTGNGSALVVTGPLGIGKSRLLAEFTRCRDAAGETVLQAQCTSDPDAPELWPWIQIVRQCGPLRPELLADRLGSRVHHLARVVPELAPALEDQHGAPPTDAFQGHHAFGDAAISLILAIASERPLAVVVDDAHWADPTSLRLLELLCRSMTDSAVLVVVAHQDWESALGSGEATVLCDIARHGDRLALPGLTEASIRRLMASRSGGEPAADLVDHVHALTGGNPLFLEEAVRLLATGDTPATLDDLPAPLLGTAVRVLDTFEAEDRAALRAAAIIGDKFREDVLGAVLDGHRARLGARLAGPHERGFIRPAVAQETWTFATPLIRQAVLSQLDARETAELHRRVGEVLRTPEMPGTADASVVASHFLAAARHGPIGPAVDCCRAAATEATAARQHRTAVQWLREAVGLAYHDTTTSEDQRFELLMLLGHAQARAGHSHSATETFDRARRLADQREDTEGTARAAVAAVDAQLRGSGWSTALEDVPARLERPTQQLAPRADDEPVLMARLLAARATVHALLSEPTVARAYAEDCRTLAATCEEVEARHAALLATRWAALGPTSLPVKRDLTEQLLLHATQSGDPWASWQAQRCRMDDGLEIGDPDMVNSAVSMGMALAEQLDEPDVHFHSHVQQATVAMLEGRFDTARELQARARQQDRSGEIPEDVILGQRLFMGWELGQVDVGLTRAVMELLPRPAARALMCWAPLGAGDPATAGAEVERFFDDVNLDGLPDGTHLPAILCMMAQAVARTGQVVHAARVYARLLPFADRCAIVGPNASVWGGSNHLYLGMLAVVLDRPEDAEEHLDQADRIHRRMGARSHLVRGHLWRARLAIRCGDAQTAGTLLEATSRQAEVLGMNGVVEESGRELEKIDGVTGASTAWTFCRDGDAWLLTGSTSSCRLHDRKGFGYLQTLLERPGTEVHVLDLVGAGMLRGRGDTGPLLDAAARAAYRRRVEDLRDQIDDGERWGDPERVARAQVELDAIAQELSASVGLGGRDRPSDEGERARVSVTKAIRSAIDAIAIRAPDAGADLHAAIQTGYYCSYQPDPTAGVSWTS